MPGADDQSDALELLGRGFELHMRGELVQAVILYSRAMDASPLPQALVHRAWALAHLGDLHGAIRDCMAAIELDPRLGLAYCDLGAYHLELGQPDDALPWLNVASRACAPEGHPICEFNLGRAWELKGDLSRALRHYQMALAERPGYVHAAQAVARLSGIPRDVEVDQ